MIDLRILRDLWTEEGGRSVFAELVTQCARTQYPSARPVRPDPGDEGVDTYVGEFDGDLRVYQSKFFCDGVSASQQTQVRSSWKTCTTSAAISKVVLWTLCIPIELSVPETQWWQRWKKKESERLGIQIELWTKTDFVSFSARDELAPVFNIALRRGTAHASAAEALSAMQAITNPSLVRRLPTSAHLKDALFVRKLEAAGVKQHRSARTAFYNFELLRTAIEQGGNSTEIADLEDLQERVFDIWEDAYNAAEPANLGRRLVVEVHAQIAFEDQRRLRTALPAQAIHKKGSLHYWADLCEAGWTADFKSITRDEDGDGT